MEILLTLTYVALCYAVFKLFRIPVNQWTLATAALGASSGFRCCSSRWLTIIRFQLTRAYITRSRRYCLLFGVV